MFNTFFFIAPFYLQGALPKRLWKDYFIEHLRITQETLQISLFTSMFLSLVKKIALHFLFTVLSYVQGALQKRVSATYFTENF